MNLENINKWLDKEYGCSYTRLEELHDWLVDKDIKNKEEISRLNNIINELEKWLNSEIKRIEGLKNPKRSTTFAPKPYGREKEYYDIMISSYKYCLNKLKELKENRI